MAKMSNEGQELILLLIMGYFLFQCIFTDNIINTGHDVFVKIGIEDKIQELDRYINR